MKFNLEGQRSIFLNKGRQTTFSGKSGSPGEDIQDNRSNDFVPITDQQPLFEQGLHNGSTQGQKETDRTGAEVSDQTVSPIATSDKTRPVGSLSLRRSSLFPLSRVHDKSQQELSRATYLEDEELGPPDDEDGFDQWQGEPEPPPTWEEEEDFKPTPDSLPPKSTSIPGTASHSSLRRIQVAVSEAPTSQPHKEVPKVDSPKRFLPTPGSAEKLPLVREKASAEPYPVEALGQRMASAAKAIQDSIQAPLALCAQSVLAAMTLGVQAHADIEVEGRVSPVSEFFLTIAESGERKTAIDKICLAPIRKMEARDFEYYSEDRRLYELEMEVYQKTTKEIAKIPDPNERREALRAIAAPEPPFMPVLTIDDPTVEGLARFFRESRPRIGMFSDEAGRFLGGYGMLKENQLKTAANLSKLWDGGAVRSVRAKDGFITIEGKRITVHLMIQPEPAADFLGNDTMENQGLFSRILISSPESTIGQRISRPPKEGGAQAIKVFQDHLFGILQEPLPVRESRPRHLIPRRLRLSAQAHRAFTSFHDEVEAELGEGGRFVGIRGFANKSPEHATRLAAILTLSEDLRAEEVSAEKMEAGVVLARYYLGEAQRQGSSATAHPSLLLAQKALNWVKNNADGNFFSAVDLYQKGPMAIRSKAKAQEMMKILEDHHQVQKVHSGMVIHGRKRQDVFQIM